MAANRSQPPERAEMKHGFRMERKNKEQCRLRPGPQAKNRCRIFSYRPPPQDGTGGTGKACVLGRRGRADKVKLNYPFPGRLWRAGRRISLRVVFLR
ncbi:hypothetical protein HMPREF9371_2094 [Neisseria shayeganii 871]|uniref:Uncharacterized protein n=1 Tax=Neisseria shayeganii 871 TaxID=1032488 RepID=G4CKF4_9NEIS|nr:hypothetical protein HMPREF9371_2094 [Neisseria shayeganii 871]